MSEQEEFLEANSYHHLHKKKYAIDQFSVIKIADLNYGFSNSGLHASTDQLNGSYPLLSHDLPVVGQFVLITHNLWVSANLEN